MAPLRPRVVGSTASGVKNVDYQISVTCLPDRTVNIEQQILEEDPSRTRAAAVAAASPAAFEFTMMCPSFRYGAHRPHSVKEAPLFGCQRLRGYEHPTDVTTREAQFSKISALRELPS